MNNKGQFSIIAALFVAVILIATVIVTYSSIRNSQIQDQPQVLSAIDETNLALKQILGFTIGYYGSVLQVTGNTSYAKELAFEYLRSGLVNIGDMHPEWGTSFNISSSNLHTYWFTNRSFSIGSLSVRYDLSGLGIYGITYKTSSRLQVHISETENNQAFLEVSKDEDEPLINLGKRNFKFYRYEALTSRWASVSPSDEPLAYANGTYQIEVPAGVDPDSYVIQVEDSRGIMVVASSFSRFTLTPSWNSASAGGQTYVNNNISNVDSSPDKGTHSDFQAQQKFDGIFDTLTEAKTDLRVKKGTFLKSTNVGAQIVTGVGFQPKAIIFWWTRQTSYGESAGIRAGYGFATLDSGLYQNCGVAIASDDNVAISNAGRQRSATYCIVILSDGTPTRTARARVTGFLADGFTLEWQTNEARADIIQYIALAGADLTAARAGSFNLATGPGTQDVGIGFQPDFAVFLWTFTDVADTGATNAELGIGFAASSTERGAIVMNSRDGVGPMDTYQQQRTDACILLLNPTSGAQDAIVDFSQFLPNGLRLSKSDPPGSTTPILYLALKGGYYHVGSFNSPTSIGNQDVTGVGFQPKLVLFATQGRAASTVIGSNAELALGGATSPTDRGTTWFEDPDGLPSSDCEMETLNTRVIQWRDRASSDLFSLRGSADFASFLSDGFRLSWSSVETAGRQIIYVAFGGHDYELDLEAQWTNTNHNGTIEQLSIYASSSATESLRVDAWHGGSWHNIIASLMNGWNNVSVSPYLDSSTFTIRFKGSNETGDLVQDSWRIDATLLKVWPAQDLYSSLQDATIVVELLQNGTMRWLGQNLQLMTLAKPIPPVPVRAIHVRQTIDGVDREVPFQIEDWASEYRIPLGLANNASVFGSRTMLVFLVNSKVSRITIWWNGSDIATQTSLAYTNICFSDSISTRTLNNGKQTLRFSASGFILTSTTGSTTSTARLMRINSEEDTTDPELAYVIYNGIVRDIVLGEAEWSGGANNCPNVYSNIVITLPANATYYTYQLRLMFVESQQSRTIADLCPIEMTVSNGSPQTENGISGGLPVVQNGTGTFYNSSSVWQHHWSQIIIGTRGAGIMFTDEANKMLYAFDNSTTKTGALKADSTARTIELLPVTRFPVSFTHAKDVTWHGAVVTFDGTTPIYQDGSGLWIIVEYPPTITVTTQS